MVDGQTIADKIYRIFKHIFAWQDAQREHLQKILDMKMKKIDEMKIKQTEQLKQLTKGKQAKYAGCPWDHDRPTVRTVNSLLIVYSDLRAADDYEALIKKVMREGKRSDGSFSISRSAQVVLKNGDTFTILVTYSCHQHHEVVNIIFSLT